MPTVTPTRPTGDRRDLLTAAVRAATGHESSQPRTGQAMLHADIREALEQRADVVAVAPTGSGKTFVTLAAAFERAEQYGERTVISTHSLSLMGQMEDKDVPTLSTVEPSVAVAFLRGVSNYVDPARVVATAQTLLGVETEDVETLATALESGSTLPGTGSFTEVGTPAQFRTLVLWALQQYTAEGIGRPGDRHSCPVPHTDAGWRAVSASAAVADDGTHYGVTSKAEEAKLRASESDVVITNHSMLAVQAAHGIRVITGGAKLGAFDNIIVDEAHALPDAVRSQGAVKISGGGILAAAHQAHRAAGSPSGRMRRWLDEADDLAEMVESELRPYTPRGRDDATRLGDGDRPLEDLLDTFKKWTGEGRGFLSSNTRDSPGSRLAAATADDRLDRLGAELKAIGRHRTGWARWVERPEPAEGRRRWNVANVSPVSVGWLLNDNVWTDPAEEESNQETAHNRAPDGAAPATEPAPQRGRRLAVVALSATLPAGFAMHAGLRAQRKVYPSPFTDSYGRSSLYIPHLSAEDAAEVASDVQWGSRPRFDTKKHATWCATQIEQLVRTNGGRALVLTATAANGKLYAAHLRRRLDGIRIHSQWDGGTAGSVVREWRDDVGSVLVGTKSMMTGVDAPGETCTLVLIDRVPRSPGNPIDDARTEEVAARLKTNTHQASLYTYVEDAALLLSQAGGRLIRSENDSGMLACLDPRMLKRSPLSYPEPTRKTYMQAMEPFAAFRTKHVALDAAVAWLEKERRTR